MAIIMANNQPIAAYRKKKQANHALLRWAGFTLIEVLLAMSIFSIAGIALLSTADTHMNNLSILEKKTYADWVASNQLVEVNLTKKWPPKNNKKGKEELVGHTWFWTQQVLKTNDADMRAVRVEVRLDENDKLALTSLTTYIAKPETRQ